MPKLGPNLPDRVTLPNAAQSPIISAGQVRQMLGIATRATLLAWTRKYSFPEPYYPRTAIEAPHYFTGDILRWLVAHGATVEINKNDG